MPLLPPPPPHTLLGQLIGFVLRERHYWTRTDGDDEWRMEEDKAKAKLRMRMRVQSAKSTTVPSSAKSSGQRPKRKWFAEHVWALSGHFSSCSSNGDQTVQIGTSKSAEAEEVAGRALEEPSQLANYCYQCADRFTVLRQSKFRSATRKKGQLVLVQTFVGGLQQKTRKTDCSRDKVGET